MADQETSQEKSSERFGFTIFLSACVHGILILGVGFTYLGELNSEPALEVTMAQYRSEIEPDDADFIAQENQIGSGTIEQAAATSTPFESDFNAETIQQVQPIPAAPQRNQVAPTNSVISSVQSDTELDQQPEEDRTDEEEVISEQSNPEDISTAIASLQAQLDRQRQAYARRPRRYTISSASTRKSHDALYLDSWRRRIEAVGNINYPEQARRQQIYGSLRLLVAILPDGQVTEIEILESSGHSVLDQAAVEIVRLASPFAPFPEELRGEADILEIIRTWRFHEGNALTSF